ncbi:hypothetical protein LEMLEM_LOCUS25085 [Lemmus lemmus]
MEICSV